MKKMKLSKKAVALTLAGAMLMVGVGSGTLAWLTDTSEEIENVFTTSDINIELNEDEKDFKMIPGWTIDKDPLVTVKAGSEDCWIFIKVEETGGNITVDGKNYTYDDFIAYKIDENNWTKLSGNTGNNAEEVYYCYAKDIESDRNIKVLAGGTYTDDDGVDYTWEPNQVLTKPEVTKEMMNALATSTVTNPVKLPTLNFTAYAVQYWKNNDTAFTPEEAWELANKANQ